MESGVDSDPFIGRRGLMKAAAVGLIAYNSASYIPDVKAQSSSLAEQKWDFETGGVVGSSPTVVEDTVYFGSLDGNLYAVETSSGELKWSFGTGDFVFSSPTVVDGTVYFGSDNLYAVETGVDGSSEGSRVLQRTLGHHRDSVGSGGRGSLWGAVLAGGAAIAGAVGYGIYRFVGEGEE